MSGKNLKKLISEEELIIAPGVFDALSSLIAHKAGFKLTIMGGYSVSAVNLAKPDLGILTMTEMVESVKKITDASPVPLIADADTGFGGEWNIKRMVKEYERAGASGIIIEDQKFPKRCGHLNGKSIVTKEEHGNRIKSAKDTANNMLVFARTDAIATSGIDEAISRAQYYLRAGADGVFIEAPKNENEILMIGRHLKGQTLIANMVEGGKTPIMTSEIMKKAGYKIIMYPVMGVYLYSKSLYEGFKTLLKDGTSENLCDKMFDFETFNELLNIKKYIKR